MATHLPSGFLRWCVYTLLIEEIWKDKPLGSGVSQAKKGEEARKG